MQSQEPLLTAIVVVPKTIGAYEHTLECLRSQTIVNSIELVFVTPSSQKIDLNESKLQCFHSWKIIAVTHVKSMGSANAAGIMEASAPIVALTEDHSFVPNNWAEQFVNRHKEKWAVIGPCMRNGNPENSIGWADFLQAYGEWMGPVSSGTVRHLPGHNSSYKKSVLLGFGAELETLMEAESVLHRHLKKQGHELYLETNIQTTHLNFNTWSSFLPCRYYTGRQFAATWSKTWQWYHRLLFAIVSPGIPFLRLWNITKCSWKKKAMSVFVRVFPALFLGIILEGFGHFVGFLSGYGDSLSKVVEYEFDRVSFLDKT